jgi:hypothetical protein
LLAGGVVPELLAPRCQGKTIDPSSFHVENWKLVRNGVSVF